MKNSIKVFLWAAVVFLTACAPRQAAEIVDRRVFTQAERDEQIGGQLIRIVKPGDTLYGIAFMAGLDIRKVAAWNNISNSSKLRVGQTVRLTEPRGFKYPEVKVASRRREPSVGSKKTVPAKAVPTVKTTRQPKPAKVTSKPKATKRDNVVKSSPSSATKTTASSKSTKWAWPFRGTIIARFNPSKGEQGVRIQGQSGQIVGAASAGEVVYAGDSLKGYGNLIIIKHTTEYLSAYAHNQTILVREGQRVEQGQAIAKLTANPLKKSIAQFQIRQHGNPVNPLNYLP